MHRLLPSALVVALLLTLSTSASAQVSASDAALAEKLFEDARQLMAQQRFAEACPKLVDSQRLDPGIGTLLNLGECFEKSGKIASAWATYREAEAAATREGQKKRAAFAGTRARALTPELSYLVIEAPDAPSGLTITCDDKPIGETSVGSPMPFDAGLHKLEARAPGHRPWEREVDLGLKATVRVTVPALEAAPEPPPAPAPAAVVVIAPPPGGEARSSGSAQRVTGLALGGLGLVGAGLGTWFGLRAKDLHDEAESLHCDPVSCTATGAAMTSDARDNATVSTVAFAVGAAALVAGAILYFTAPSASRAAQGTTGGRGLRTARPRPAPALWYAF